MKTLNTIQKLSRLGRIFSRIIYVASLVGAILCAFGIFGLVAIPDNFKLGGTTIHGLIELSDKLNLGMAIAGAAEAMNALPLGEVETVLVNVSRSKKLGGYHLLAAQNPVYIFSRKGNGHMHT